MTMSLLNNALIIIMKKESTEKYIFNNRRVID